MLDPASQEPSRELFASLGTVGRLLVQAVENHQPNALLELSQTKKVCSI